MVWPRSSPLGSSHPPSGCAELASPAFRRKVCSSRSGAMTMRYARLALGMQKFQLPIQQLGALAHRHQSNAALAVGVKPAAMVLDIQFQRLLAKSQPDPNLFCSRMPRGVVERLL